MAIGVINHGRRYDKPRPSLYETTGNEISNHGQRNFKPRATKFTQIPLFFAKGEHIVFLFLYAYIYIRLQKKKSISDSRAPPKKPFFFTIKLVLRLSIPRGCAVWKKSITSSPSAPAQRGAPGRQASEFGRSTG